MSKILIVDDEEKIRVIIKKYAVFEGYDIDEADDGAKAIEKVKLNDYDLVILDIMMPVVDGLEVCKYIRERNKRIGIIMLTARTQEMDKVTGLMVGADDYVTKPFSPSELMARIDAIYRRVSLTVDNTFEKNTNSAISLNEFVLDLRSHTLTKNGEPVELTQVEFQIMEFFFSNPNVALERNEILKFVWGDSYFGDEKVVDVNIHRLRNKIEDEPSQPKHLTTVWGMGYKWII